MWRFVLRWFLSFIGQCVKIYKDKIWLKLNWQTFTSQLWICWPKHKNNRNFHKIFHISWIASKQKWEHALNIAATSKNTTTNTKNKSNHSTPTSPITDYSNSIHKVYLAQIGLTGTSSFWKCVLPLICIISPLRNIH